jgi:hypothetical protein
MLGICGEKFMSLSENSEKGSLPRRPLITLAVAQH